MIFLSMFNSVLLNMIIQSSFTHRTSVCLSFSSERQKEMLWQIFTLLQYFTSSVYSDQWLSFQDMKDTSCVNYDRMVIFGWTFSVSMKLSSMFNYISLNRWCNFLLKSLVKAAAQQLPWHKCWCWDHIVRACVCVCVCRSPASPSPTSPRSPSWPMFSAPSSPTLASSESSPVRCVSCSGLLRQLSIAVQYSNRSVLSFSFPPHIWAYTSTNFITLMHCGE